MTSSPKKIVNSEEQIRTVNPADTESAPERTRSDNDLSRENVVNDHPAEFEKPDRGSERSTSDPIEGDDAGSIERQSDNL